MSAPIPKLTPSGLAALMCARLCHDLVSPIGALATALEVLEDEDNAEMYEDALALVKTSAGQASAKLQYLRLAFGGGGSTSGIMATPDVQNLVNGMYGGGKIDILWGEGPEVVEKSCACLLLNLVMLATQAIPRGGQVKITVERNDSEDRLLLVSDGDRARLDPTVVGALAGKAPETGFDGRTIQPFYAGMIGRELQGQIMTAIEGTIVTFTAIIPR